MSETNSPMGSEQKETRRHSQSANLHHKGKQILNTNWSHPAKAHQKWSKTLRYSGNSLGTVLLE